MRFRIWHLLLLMGLTAFCCLLIERYIYRMAIFRVTAVQPNDDSYFQIEFEVADGDSPYLQSGVASGRFGDNSFFEKKLTSKTYESLVGTTVKIRYRDRDFLWLQHHGWGRKLSGHFPDVVIWPNVEEWQANRFFKEHDHERRKRARLTTRN